MGNETKKVSGGLPAAVRKGARAAVRFRISEGMVGKFAELTGDFSPLHTDAAFARKSIYRQIVVHGMLPVGFVPLLGFFNIDGYVCEPVEISARFIEPSFINDSFILSSEIEEADPGTSTAKVRFSIENEKTGSAVTSGAVTVRYSAAAKDRSVRPSQKASAASPGEAARPMDLLLGDIKKTDTDRLGFTVTGSEPEALLAILSEGTGSALDAAALSSRFGFSSLFPVLLFSTSVGMRIPGRQATFLEFSATVKGKVAPGSYCLKGEVSHVSEATRIIKKDITVVKEGAAEEVLAAGRVSVIVNALPASMPSVKRLKEKAVDMGLRDKVALVTGASRGIGETTAKMLALLGARVVVNYYRGEEDALRIAEEIKKDGGRAIAVRADVSDRKQVRAMVGRAVEEFGTVNILVNSAVRDFRPANFLKLDWEDVQKDIDVVAKGAFNCCKEVIPLMLESGGGKIINISTVATDNPPPNQLKYVLSKSALVGLTRSLAADFASKNIQVNMVVPNFVETDLTSHIPEAYRKKIAQETPMRRNAAPEDVAHAVVFLASDYSSFTTGQKIMVTGGGAPYL